MAPLWYMSNGRISHRMISNELSNFVSVFTPCLISTPKTIGSDITRLDRSRWVIAWDMTGDLPIFKDPFTGAKVRTKDFVAHPPPLGMTYSPLFDSSMRQTQGATLGLTAKIGYDRVSVRVTGDLNVWFQR